MAARGFGAAATPITLRDKAKVKPRKVRTKSAGTGAGRSTQRTAQPKPYRHQDATKKTALWPSFATTPKPAKARQMPKPKAFKPKPLRQAAAKPHAMTPRPLARLPVSPVRRPALLRVPIVRLSEPLPETAYKEAKAQLRVMRRAARILRKADHAQERAVQELVRHAAHDMGERQRQAREANREHQRQQREQDRAEATRPAAPTRTTGQPPQL